MASTDYDVIVGGTKAKVLRSEDGGYRKRTIRREVEQQLLSQSENPGLTSRADQRQLFQTSWAGGSRWWKPLMGPQEADSYFQATNMDVWSEPGKVVPANKITGSAETDLHDHTVIGIDDSADLFAIGDTTNVDATNLDVYKWDSSSDVFSQETGYTSGVSGFPRAMVFDPSDGYFYNLGSNDEVNRFNPSTSDTGADWLTGAIGTTAIGATIFLQNQTLMVYTNDKLYSIDKSGPSATQEFDDGMGADALTNASFASTDLFRTVRLAISTPSGIFYVKNTFQGGLPVAWIFRVEKDAAGNWIGNPIATLPEGSLALSIISHLGSIIISAATDWRTIFANVKTSHSEVVLYHITQNQIGALGSMLGDRDELDETPFALMGSRGALLYIGGQKRLWVYDAARGGLHTAHEWSNTPSDGPYRQMAFVQDSNSDGAIIYLGTDVIAQTKTGTSDDPDTVTNFGDDETHYTLTSNYFDGGLPLETKELTRVAILRESDDGGSEWTVQIAADGGSFSDALTDSGTNEYAEADLTGTTGRRFQYKLIYQTKDTARKALEALYVSFTTGQMITEWDLILDGEELLNVDNEVQDEESFYDNMVTLAGTSDITTLVDNMQEQAQETDSGTTTNVKVQAVEIIKEKPGESAVRIVLREA